MAETIFVVLVFAAILLVGVAWTIALRQNRLARAWIERTGRRTMGSVPMSYDRGQTRDGAVASDR